MPQFRNTSMKEVAQTLVCIFSVWLSYDEQAERYRLKSVLLLEHSYCVDSGLNEVRVLVVPGSLERR